MQLLMDGSRNLSNNNVTGAYGKLAMTPPTQQSRSDGLRQMALTPRGGICLSGGDNSSTVASCLPLPMVCSACPVGVTTATNCSFCESPLCAACVASCVRCGGTFCRHCRVVVYEQHDDLTICLSCNR